MSSFTTQQPPSKSPLEPIPCSLKAKRTTNPIRNIVDSIKPPTNHPKKLLNLALGDPTIHGNLHCPSVLREAVQDSLSRHAGNGYLPSVGCPLARKAIATYTARPGSEVAEDDVIIASGCSGALELAINALLNEGDNLLVPVPGFPLYQVITDSLGGSVKPYPLMPERDWECDLVKMEEAIDANTRVILISNPSNPCGSNFSKEHLEGIVAVAARHGLPIIADEIYGGCVFNGEFTPIHTVRQNVPILTMGGLAKEFVVPGWRVGWVVLHDCMTDPPRLGEIRAGLRSLTQLIVGANSLIQSAIPRVLTPAPQTADAHAMSSYIDRYMHILRTNAAMCVYASADCPEISVIEPKGAMYVMIKIDLDALADVKDDTEFSQLILMEENVFMLPGKCFGMSGYIRLVTCAPVETLQEAFERIKLFCRRHRKASDPHSKGLDMQASREDTTSAASKVVEMQVCEESAIKNGHSKDSKDSKDHNNGHANNNGSNGFSTSGDRKRKEIPA